jgi:TonB family protein
MNRLQKKCFIATAGFHLLLLVILLVGPAFFNSKPKVDDSQVLNVIPANLIDAAFNSGVRNAQPPAPAPVSITQPQPITPAPKPIVTPAPAPSPTLAERLEKFFTPEPAKPEPAPIENQQHKIQVNTQLVTRIVPKSSVPQKPKNNSQAINSALQNLRQHLSSATTIEMPGDSSVSYANYASVVKSVYEQAWAPPDNTASDDANAKVTVTIASDGTVISAHVVSPSGDDSVDASVQRTLDRVTFIAPFPEGTMDKQRTYTINFNLKSKRMLE